MSDYKDPRDHKAEQVFKFLKNMSAIESSSGKDTAHRELASGMHKGTAAVGDYGIMPNTAIEIGNRANIPELKGVTPEEAQILLKINPQLAERVASTMASGLLDKTDEETASYMWEHGHNKIPDTATVEKSPRTRKFRILKQKKSENAAE